MAEIDTSMLAAQHADIRRETAAAACELSKQIGDSSASIRREGSEHAHSLSHQIGDAHTDTIKEVIKNSFDTRGDVKDSSRDIADRVESNGDRLSNQAAQFYIAGQAQDREAARDLATLTTLTNTYRNELLGQIQEGVNRNAAAVALESQKTATAVALGQHELSRQISEQNEKTRDLINDHKYHDLNRLLVERNAELVEERDCRRKWQRDASQAQWGAQFAQLQSMMQNFNSQLAETRQGMVNFGSMNGVGQTSTSNNVR